MQNESFQESAACGAYYKPTSSGIFYLDNLSDSFSLPNYINSTTTTNQALGHIVQNNQDLVNRHNLCLMRLRDSLLENEQLRVENTTLRDINELLRSILIKNYPLPPLQMNPLDVPGLMKGFGGISIGSGERSSQSDRFNVDSPTSVLPENSDLVENDQRVTLPKSISVRSNVYLKGQQGAGSSSAGGAISSGGTAQGRSSSRVRPASPLSGKQKVYVQGGKEEGEPVELEVYNQGMFKTELCNKWQETGECPYGNHCQFAHGIDELRPVIRHPRYKTEVCRMVLAGDSCPYGHRCHFRHALTDEEKLMMIRHS